MIEDVLKKYGLDIRIDFGARWLYWSASDKWKVLEENVEDGRRGYTVTCYHGNSLQQAMKHLIKLREN